MRNLKLFTKIFLYTFLVMLFVTAMAHVFLYVLAPQMTVSTNRFVEGAIIESAVNTGILIKSAIGKALPVSLLCCAIISAGCSLLFSRAMTRPIKQIAEITEKMEKLDKSAVCVVHTKDEIGELAARVNKLYASLLSTIENLEEEKRKASEAEQSKIDFLRAASHELKTPVTALNAILENMILGVGKYKDRDTCLLECREITGQLSFMIKEILDTSRLDFIQEKQDAETFELSERLPAICEPYQLIAKAKGLDFSFSIQGKCPVHTSKKSLEKILSNLLSNAVAYTKPGCKITVLLTARQIKIENECTPIQPISWPMYLSRSTAGFCPGPQRWRKWAGAVYCRYAVKGVRTAISICGHRRSARNVLYPLSLIKRLLFYPFHTGSILGCYAVSVATIILYETEVIL